MSATVHTALRITEEDREQLKQLAEAHELSFNRYVVDAALGRLPATQSEQAQQVADHERRLLRLEDLAF